MVFSFFNFMNLRIYLFIYFYFLYFSHYLKLFFPRKSGNFSWLKKHILLLNIYNVFARFFSKGKVAEYFAGKASFTAAKIINTHVCPSLAPKQNL